MSKKNSSGSALILRAVAITVSIVPALIAVLSYFPAFVTRGSGTVISGISALLIILAAVPLYKAIRKVLKSPSAWMMWLIIFLVFFLVSDIAAEIEVISFVGLVSNILGAVLFKVAKRLERNEEKL